MINEKGSISVHTENIFPIIKKWLYSDKDIFIRELVSNGADAITKLKRLSGLGEAQVPQNTKYRIDVVLDKDNGTIQVTDNGIGMTAEEVKKYINQVAFSSAQEFIQKYKDQAGEEGQIIGHFGLGFYSAFMVADKVQIDTKSYKENEGAVRWVCTGGTDYEMSPSNRTERGTTVTLTLAEDSKEFLEEYRLREILIKYCGFLPVEIFLENAVAKREKIKKGEKLDEPKPINDTHPLWLKNPSDCSDEEYKEFYRKVFLDFQEPLFWIHLNVDYPFKLKGILYFPKLRNEFESIEGQIKLYNNQVFVADNIKEVIPEFLMLLKGTIDCPDLPLNVSRSFLQNDGYVRKISAHISKKVADKLTGLYKNDRENYDKYWDDINPFVKFGCMRDSKFYDRVKDIIIFKTLDEDYVSLKEYLERNKDKHKNKVFYISDPKQQAQYINLFKENGLEAVYLTSIIDGHFIQFLEMKENGIKFNRVDADISDTLKESREPGSKDEEKKIRRSLEKVFKSALKNEKLKIKVENLKSTSVPAMILLSEDSRRIQEMADRFGNPGMAGSFSTEETLVLNGNNELIQMIYKLGQNGESSGDEELICKHIYDLAMMGHKQLEPQEMTAFIERSNRIMTRLVEMRVSK